MIKDDREEILNRLRAADIPDSVAPPLPAAATPAPHPNRRAAFANACDKNSMALHTINNEGDIPAAVADYCRAQRINAHALCEPSLLSCDWQASGMQVEARAATTKDTCGITRVRAAAADTATLLITDDTPHAFSISMLPPHHIAILNEKDLTDTLAQLWQQLPTNLPRGCRLISGPSRTADIEQTLTLGVHGPIAVLVLLITNE